MKRLLPCLLLAAALPSEGAIALVANAKGVSTDTNDAVSTAMNSGGANLIVAVNRVAVIASFKAAGGASDGGRRRVILCQ